MAVLLLLLAACNEAPPEERPNAPGTPEEQMEALEQAVDEAVEARNFARAEVALETLVELAEQQEPKGSRASDNEYRARLSIIRKRRKADQILREVEHLIDLRAFRTAKVRLDYLDNRRLHEDDAEQVTLLRELLELAKQEEAGSICRRTAQVKPTSAATLVKTAQSAILAANEGQSRRT